MSSCEFVFVITSLACGIAKEKSQEEIDVLAAAFSQLGDTLATISVTQNNCKETDKSNTILE